ncbi:TIGR01457 family HAD-type hydrolase [Furfurilactobacillus entadae]|uniref:TIGR01457 family HAD-type hydrolase n=1 Tax=Furfurilactobacillus entadae TaxID=2922307 RepID=UPI0035E5E2A2
MSTYSGYFIDLDGTIYQGTTAIPTAQTFMSRLIESGRPYLFVTNNSTRSPEAVAENLRRNHHIETTAAHVYTTAMATADYLVRKADGQALTAYVIGEQGLRDALTSRGFTLVATAAEQPTFVVVGLDRDVTYEKFVQAVLAIQNGATFIGTNLDTNIPNQRGMLPGAGAVVDFVRYATDVTPITIGKPSTIIMNEALARIGLSKEAVLMIGDNLRTDIQAANNAGMDSLLTLTGLSTVAQIKTFQIEPTHIVNDLTEWQL